MNILIQNICSKYNKIKIMFRVIALCGLVAIVTAAPIKESNGDATITYFKNENDGKGNYKFIFETSNGISREEEGTVMNEGTPEQYISVYGKVSYIDPDGHFESFRYAADQNGYRILPPTRYGGGTPAYVATLLG